MIVAGHLSGHYSVQKVIVIVPENLAISCIGCGVSWVVGKIFLLWWVGLCQRKWTHGQLCANPTDPSRNLLFSVAYTFVVQ